MIDYNALLTEIVDSQKKNKEGNSSTKNFVKTDTINNNIVGRLLPNIKDVKNSIVNYHWHGWKSRSKPDTRLFFLCPSTFGERCPICTQSIKYHKSGDPKLKLEAKVISRRSNSMVNWYTISDTKDPKNNGTVKILRYGFQIEAKIKLATEGEDKNIFGPRVWRLDNEGCNFRIKCEQNSQSKEAWPTYTNSSFLPASPIEGMTDEKQQQILNSVFDLTKQFELKSYDELERELNKHFLIGDIIDINSMGKTTSQQIPALEIQQESVQNESSKVKTQESANTVNNIPESEIDKMLAELQGGKK